jgi:hypothetical protein
MINDVIMREMGQDRSARGRVAFGAGARQLPKEAPLHRSRRSSVLNQAVPHGWAYLEVYRLRKNEALASLCK